MHPKEITPQEIKKRNALMAKFDFYPLDGKGNSPVYIYVNYETALGSLSHWRDDTISIDISALELTEKNILQVIIKLAVEHGKALFKREFHSFIGLP